MASFSLRDLVQKLLVTDRTKRLGNMKGGAGDVKKHKWFKDVDWNDVIEKNVPVSRRKGASRVLSRLLPSPMLRWSRIHRRLSLFPVT
jgi:hypothetical protein